MYDAGLPAVIAKVAVPPWVGAPEGCEEPAEELGPPELEPPEHAAASSVAATLAAAHPIELLRDVRIDRLTGTPVPGSRRSLWQTQRRDQLDLTARPSGSWEH
jgi:hypothetical protein